ncbi:hypothetical protein [Actinotalea sp. K2]|uniref:hypothetical protein n=1 Tax=Actinotalea sp. K2 TaxID=2939438 RepID=UPI0020175D68|nr:hypothetical protein [Actinotalea sp. K2]MCL3862397.1 hypothetical protein [Actinotalea sp. K2]
MSFLTTRARRPGRAVLLAMGTLLALPTAASAAASPTAATSDSGPCPDGAGVTVVVDFTDLDGEVEIGCAPDAATGTEALLAAGFLDTRDAAGMICAIDSSPDPCPTTWEGSYWSYWHATPDGEWESYEVGSDTSTPAAGEVEGWRYHDGSQGPTTTPASALEGGAPEAEATPGTETTSEPEPGDGEAAGEGTDAQDEMPQDDAAPASAEEGSGPSGLLVAGGALLLVLVAAGAWVARRRGTQADPATDGSELPPAGR